mgnify:CR=1 FL=1
MLASGAPPDEASRRDDAIERASVDHEVLEDGKGLGTEGLDPDGVTVAKLAEVELTRGDAARGSVRKAVDHHSARAADALAAVVVEGDGFLAALDEFLVQRIEQLEKGHVGLGVPRLVADETSFRGGRGLAPYVKHELHT